MKNYKFDLNLSKFTKSTLIFFECHIKIITIAVLMSLFGIFILNYISDNLGQNPDGISHSVIQFPFLLNVVVVSVIIWISTYHLAIKRGMNLKKYLSISILVPLLGCATVVPIYGLLCFITFPWVFVPISLLTCLLIDLITRHNYFGRRI